MKRIMDIVVSAIALVLLSPILLLVSLAVKIDSPGTVFYRGERVGLHGKTFKIFKFRSMVMNADKKGASSTPKADMRITRIGVWIRRFKLDELSQLINVLLGDMSLVGPRPEVQKFVDKYTDSEKIILSVRPGITDWSSILFHDEGEILAASRFEDPDEAYEVLIRPTKIKLQLKYVQESTLVTDILILIATLTTLVSTRLGLDFIGVPVPLIQMRQQAVQRREFNV